VCFLGLKLFQQPAIDFVLEKDEHWTLAFQGHFGM